METATVLISLISSNQWSSHRQAFIMPFSSPRESPRHEPRSRALGHGKFVKVIGWVGPEEAKQEISQGVQRHAEAKDKPAF